MMDFGGINPVILLSSLMVASVPIPETMHSISVVPLMITVFISETCTSVFATSALSAP